MGFGMGSVILAVAVFGILAGLVAPKTSAMGAILVLMSGVLAAKSALRLEAAAAGASWGVEMAAKTAAYGAAVVFMLLALIVAAALFFFGRARVEAQKEREKERREFLAQKRAIRSAARAARKKRLGRD